MIARVTLELAKKSSYADATIHLFLPVRFGAATQYGLPVLFQPFGQTVGPWPAAHGIWDIKDVYARVEYDEDENELFLVWSDGDEGFLDLNINMVLMVGRILTFKSVSKTNYELKVTHIQVL